MHLNTYVTKPALSQFMSLCEAGRGVWCGRNLLSWHSMYMELITGGGVLLFTN